MTPDKLARMANEIAAFFRAYPEDEACAGIQEHIEAFWTRGMRATLQAHVEAGGAGLDPLTTKALQGWGQGSSPISKETASPIMGGQLASDAG